MDERMTVRVVLADDQALLRSTFALLIDSADDLHVVGEAATGEEALAVIRREVPDVVLMDIRMPVLDGIAATALVGEDDALADVHIIMLTTFETEELVVAALRAGAAAYLGKGVEPVALLDAIRTVAAGDALLSPAATRAVITRVLGTPSGGAGTARELANLTPREREILTFVGLGLSNDQIADHLVISATTVKTHVNRTMTKLGVRDRSQLVIAAYESGLVTPGRSVT